MARVLLRRVVGRDVPALAAVDQRVGLDRAASRSGPRWARSTRARSAGAPRSRGSTSRATSESSASARATSRPSRPISPSALSIFWRAVTRCSERCVAEEVDRGDQRVGLDRQQPRRAVEGVGVGLGVDLDLLALDLGVEHVGAAAEVDDVEDADVLAQLLLGDLQLLAGLLDRQAAARAAGGDQHGGERDEAGEALGPDRRLLARAARRLGGLGVVGAGRAALGDAR